MFLLDNQVVREDWKSAKALVAEALHKHGAKLCTLRRELDLSEKVLRHLILSCEAVPETENELAAAEQAEGFLVPAPPPDDAPEPKREEERPPLEDTIEVPDLNDLEDLR